MSADCRIAYISRASFGIMRMIDLSEYFVLMLGYSQRSIIISLCDNSLMNRQTPLYKPMTTGISPASMRHYIIWSVFS